jgi:hypothetical protein
MKSPPQHIKEFSTIAALIFDDLYSAFPEAKRVDRSTIAKAMGLEDENGALESGRSFATMSTQTVTWLVDEGYLREKAYSPYERLILTAKSLAAMGATPPGFSESNAEVIAKNKSNAASAEGQNRLAGVIGDLVGSFAGSFAKSASSP